MRRRLSAPLRMLLYPFHPIVLYVSSPDPPPQLVKKPTPTAPPPKPVQAPAPGTKKPQVKPFKTAKGTDRKRVFGSAGAERQQNETQRLGFGI